MRSFLKKVLNRVCDRTKAPRRWWFPTTIPVNYDPEDLRKLHAECSDTVRKTSLVLLGYCFFSLVSLGASDESLLGMGKTIKLPFADTEISFLAFLHLTPVILIAITVYLHIFVGQSLRYSVSGLKAEKRLMTLFNVDEPMAKFVSEVLLYWLVPVLLVCLTWKALPRPEAPRFVILTCAVMGVLVFLQIRRCSAECRYRNRLLWLVLMADVGFLLITIWLITVTGEMPVSRSLSLFRAKLQNIDLRYFNMQQAYLREAQLSEADLIGANLRQAKLIDVDLSKARLIGANLSGANLDGADLNGANLSGANLQRASLRESLDKSLWDAMSGLVGTYRTVANLSGANLNRANLIEANLSGANLSRVNLLEAKVSRANLSGVNLYRAILTRTDLSGANLGGANLSEAELSGANLTRTNLNAADLRGANLAMADLRQTSIHVDRLCQARILGGIRLDDEMRIAVEKKCPVPTWDSYR